MILEASKFGASPGPSRGADVKPSRPIRTVRIDRAAAPADPLIVTSQNVPTSPEFRPKCGMSDPRSGSAQSMLDEATDPLRYGTYRSAGCPVVPDR